MPRRKLRSQRRLVERCAALRREVTDALPVRTRRRPGRRRRRLARRGARHAPVGARAAGAAALRHAVRDRGGRRGRPVGRPAARGRRDRARARRRARLWHWRARTTLVQGIGDTELPERYSTSSSWSARRRCAATRRACCRAPLRGDFRAFGKVYRQLSESAARRGALDRVRAPPRARLALWSRKIVGRRHARHLIEPSISSPRWNASTATPT